VPTADGVVLKRAISRVNLLSYYRQQDFFCLKAAVTMLSAFRNC